MKILALLLAACAGCFGYVNSNPYNYRTDNTNIQFLVNVDSANANNSKGVPWITPGSDVMAGTIAAMGSWNSVVTAKIHFATPQTTSLFDGTASSNVISFDPSEEIGQAIGAAIAVTFRSFNSNGSIIKTDIVFSPDDQFTTTGDATALDLQSILTHELGHCLGASHTGVLSGTMFQATDPGLTAQAHLRPDDIAFASFTYPVGNGYGSIAGTMVDTTGKPLRGALISAEDPVSGEIIGGFSSITDGSFSFAVPPGSYYVWAEPLNGQVKVGNLYLSATEVDTNWQPVIAGGFTSPSTFLVTAGQTTTVALSAPTGISPIEFTFAGSTTVAGQSFEIYSGPAPFSGGQAVYFVFEATGLSSTLTEANFKSIGPVSIAAQSFHSLGGNQYQLTLTGPSVSALTSDTLMVSYNGSLGMLSGGIVLEPPVPSFPANGVGNVFSYSSTAVAPGEIVAIFGTNLGASAGLSGSFSSTGYLTDQLDGISVRFDGIPAPLFFTGAAQVNVQVPYEVAGNATTNVVVDTGVDSTSVTLPVLAAMPGLFTDAVNFLDGALNSASDPVAPGDYVILYATGLGSLETPIDTGQAAPGADAAANALTANVGGVPVAPYYAGATPGYAGLEQISVQIPQHAVAGETPLYVTSAAGGQSQTISVWVK